MPPPHADLCAFVPTPWLRGAHAQTLWGSLRQPRHRAATVAHTLELPDGDAITLHQAGVIARRPAVLLLHGLEGSLRSPYAPELLAAFVQRGWSGTLLHARGSAQMPNRLRRGYHSGDWADISAAHAHLMRSGATCVAAVGVSLGGNQLLAWLGDRGADCPLRAAVTVSAPHELAATADALSHGLSRWYQHHFIKQMQASVVAKQRMGIDLGPIDPTSLRTFRAFDDALTAPHNGFAGVDDYYNRCSSARRLATIARPTLMLAAADDPFWPATARPDPTQVPAAVELRVLPAGGHVGFLTGWWPRPWLPSAVCGWLAQHLDQPEHPRHG